jgi:4-hydroxybenzoate polyprenyltransferase
MPVADQTTVVKKKRSKTLFQSMTVFSALLMLIAYAGARAEDAPQDCLQSILVLGTAAIAIFLRRSIKTPKPLWRSMTLWSSLGMVGAYAAALYEKVTPAIRDWIFIVGAVIIAIYLRRAIINMYGDKA